MTAPRIHITNWTSRKLHGPGLAWTIMARPRPQYGECGAGWVSAFIPNEGDLDDVRSGRIDVASYRRRFRYKVELYGLTALAPGFLMARVPQPAPAAKLIAVAGGDTLCCACSKEKAANGECHRVWVAEFLRDAGWDVVLDGKELK